MNKNIASLMCQISTTWLIDDIRDIKTCETKTDDYSQRRIGMMVEPYILGIGDSALFTYRYNVESDDRDSYRASCMVTSYVDEIHVLLDEENKCVTASIYTQNTIYILHADVDISGLNVAVIDDIIQKINKELEEAV